MRISVILAAGIALLAACSQSAIRETPSGFKFTVVKEGTGEVARPAQYVVFNFRVTDSQDSIWVDTYDRGYPEFSRIQDSSAIAHEDGITQMLRMLSTGDSATFSLTIAELFRDFARQPVPPHLDSSLVVTYAITVREIVKPEDFAEFQSRMEEDYYAFMNKNATEQLGKDTVAIDSFLSERNIVAHKLPSGIRYVIHKEGTGPLAQAGQAVMVDYAGYLLDGTYFDTSIKATAEEKGLFDARRDAQNGYRPYEVVIDQTSVIQGWHHALKQLNEGAEGTFYIPSGLAYGPQAFNGIKANSVLVFDLKMVDIK
ncbi:MAG: FKBP-type peptidyl-prolyl cis-trans isomerase [Cyclobacteriaceae bacterium]|nr:FKBP-type peptidyl-prolyl cis-trans isomerase [Cyclobacteriaceae bacterium]